MTTASMSSPSARPGVSDKEIQLDALLFKNRYGRDIIETETHHFHNGEAKEVTFAISNASLDDPDYSEQGRFHLHKNTLLKSIFIFAESFRGFDQREVIRDLLALKECCLKEALPEKDVDS